MTQYLKLMKAFKVRSLNQQNDKLSFTSLSHSFALRKAQIFELFSQ